MDARTDTEILHATPRSRAGIIFLRQEVSGRSRLTLRASPASPGAPVYGGRGGLEIAICRNEEGVLPPAAEAFFFPPGSSALDQPVWKPSDEVMATYFRNHRPSRKRTLPETLAMVGGFKGKRRSASSPNLGGQIGVLPRKENSAASPPETGIFAAHDAISTAPRTIQQQTTGSNRQAGETWPFHRPCRCPLDPLHPGPAALDGTPVRTAQPSSGARDKDRRQGLSYIFRYMYIYIYKSLSDMVWEQLPAFGTRPTGSCRVVHVSGCVGICRRMHGGDRCAPVLVTRATI